MNKYLRRQLGLKKAKKVLNIFRGRFYHLSCLDGDYYNDPETIGKMLNTRVRCSCWMCGNPRRHFKVLTRQELGSILEFENELKGI